MPRLRVPLITSKMKEIAKRHDPTEYIKRHNERVKNLVYNKKIVEDDITILFDYLNRLFYSDLIVGVNIRWSLRMTR